MDRDVAQLILSKLTDINSALSLIVGNTTPVAPSSASLSMAPLMTGALDPEAAAVEDSEVPREETEEPETIPEETKETKTKK